MRADSTVAASRSQRGRDFEEFFDAEFPRVVAYCLALGLARPAAEDITQEAFLTVLRRWDTITNPPAYLRKVAFHLAIRRPYEIPHHDLATSQAPARSDAPSPLEERHVVLEALRQLPSQQQAVFALFFDDQPIPDIAEALDISAATVRSHLRHARRRLGVWWRRRHGDGSHDPEETTP
jgi:RNA polymerase sigma-70 factor, ECF subfamily